MTMTRASCMCIMAKGATCNMKVHNHTAAHAWKFLQLDLATETVIVSYQSYAAVVV